MKGEPMKRSGRRTFMILCLAPAVVLFTLFMLYPAGSIFVISLYKWGGYSANKTFVGLSNFSKLFQDAVFWRSFANTVFLIVTVTAVTVVLSLFFAAVLTREKLRGGSFFRVVFYIPAILSVVAVAAVFSAVYDPRYGLLNGIISLFRAGGDPILWLGDRSIVIYSIALAMIWQAAGYYMVMYMAGMSAVPESLYESASIEGAGRVRQFFSVTLPLIWQNIRTTLTFFIISNINISFLLVRAMTSGGPDGASEVFLSYMYKQAYTNSSYGYGMAIGVVVFVFSFALAGAVNLITRRKNLEI